MPTTWFVKHVLSDCSHRVLQRSTRSDLASRVARRASPLSLPCSRCWQFTGAKTFTGVGKNVGEKNAIMDNFAFVVGETGLLQARG